MYCCMFCSNTGNTVGIIDHDNPMDTSDKSLNPTTTVPAMDEVCVPVFVHMYVSMYVMPVFVCVCTCT